MNQTKNKGGYTLIELLIYTVIFAISVGVFSGVLITFTRVQTQTSADSEITQQLSFVQSTIQRLVRDSVNIQNPAGVASSSLVLRMASTTLDPTIISSDANGIYLKQGTGAIAPLTNSQVKVSQFQATKYENPQAHAIVQINLSLTYNSQNPYQQITRALKIAIGRVSAATFDDSLVPNVDNSYSLGIASVNRWKDINISNLLNVGQLTIDPVAGAQNGSIYYNTASNAFRGYANGAWSVLGGVGWAASSTNIYNTNAGNVGIGLSNPSYTLDVTGSFRASATSTFSGNVGIGTASPAYKLTVNGSVGLGNVIYTLISTAQGGIDSYTKLALHADGSDQSTTFTDSSSGAKTITNTEAYDSYTQLMLHANGSDQGTTFTDSATSKTVTNTEAYDSYTKLMLHMEGSGASFTDSAASKTVTANGSVTQTTAQYKFGSKSGVFNATTDYLTLADSADWAFGSGDFTLDGWFRWNSITSGLQALWTQGTDGNNLFQVYTNTDGSIGVGWLVNGSWDVNYKAFSGLTSGTWYHIAIVRNGSNFYIFVNGVSQDLTVYSAIGTKTLADYTGLLFIGAREAGGPTYFFNGWMDELRVSKGVARWTSNFTPPASSYGTVATVTSQKEFGTASGFFDGSGSYLSLADSADWTFGTGDFTIDTWVRFTNIPASGSGNERGIFGQASNPSNYYGLSYWNLDDSIGRFQFIVHAAGAAEINLTGSWSALINANQWYHIAVVRSSNNWSLYVDGTGVVTQSVSYTMPDLTGAFEIGRSYDYYANLVYFKGYIDELRVSKGPARWNSDFTPPPCPYGLACTLTSQKEFGTASGFFSSGGANLSLADSNDWNFGTGDFTIDFWAKWNGIALGDYTTIVGQSVDPNNYWHLFFKKYANPGSFWSFQAYSPSGSTPVANGYTSDNWLPNIGQWYHIAFVRSGTVGYLFIDGVKHDYTVTTNFGTMPDLAGSLYLGYNANQNYFFNGWIDELRVSKGIARWTANFTPPSAPYDSGTPGANNVGIGTASPNYTLDVNGNVNATAYYGSGANLTGVGDTKYSDTRFKVGSFTRDLTAASGDVSYTGVGFQPKAIEFSDTLNTSGGIFSTGYDDGASHKSVFVYGASANYTQNDSYSIYLYDGTNQAYAYIKSFDADGFTLTWGKVSSPTGLLYVKYKADR